MSSEGSEIHGKATVHLALFLGRWLRDIGWSEELSVV
jgi:hypothetical protein